MCIRLDLLSAVLHYTASTRFLPLTASAVAPTPARAAKGGVRLIISPPRVVASTWGLHAVRLWTAAAPALRVPGKLVVTAAGARPVARPSARVPPSSAGAVPSTATVASASAAAIASSSSVPVSSPSAKGRVGLLPVSRVVSVLGAASPRVVTSLVSWRVLGLGGAALPAVRVSRKLVVAALGALPVPIL